MRMNDQRKTVPCPACNRRRLIGQFRPIPGKPGKRHSWCRDCERAYNQRRRAVRLAAERKEARR